MKKFILFSMLLFSSTFALADSKAKTTTPTNHHCQNLSKIQDSDDLLYQMYSNIDSQCLFKMDTQALEKIWGIPILDFSQTQTDDGLDLVRLRKEQLYQNYSIPTLFLEKHGYGKEIYFTLDSNFPFRKLYPPNYDGNIQEGKLPKFLIKPISYHIYDIKDDLLEKSMPNSEYTRNTHYIWCNTFKSKNKSYLDIFVNNEQRVARVELHNQFPIHTNYISNTCK